MVERHPRSFLAPSAKRLSHGCPVTARGRLPLSGYRILVPAAALLPFQEQNPNIGDSSHDCAKVDLISARFIGYNNPLIGNDFIIQQMTLLRT
jgi:hypothetical protein